VLESVDAVVTRVEITDLREGTFYGKVHVLRSDVEESELDARPSDAIALAVRFQAPILVARKVFEDAAVPVTEKAETAEAGDPADKVEGHDESLEPVEGAETAETLPERKAEGKPLSPVDALKAALDAAVRAERYEEAARLRDDLKRLNTGN
jgi:hypothetical protein